MNTVSTMLNCFQLSKSSLLFLKGGQVQQLLKPAAFHSLSCVCISIVWMHPFLSRKLQPVFLSNNVVIMFEVFFRSLCWVSLWLSLHFMYFTYFLYSFYINPYREIWVNAFYIVILFIIVSEFILGWPQQWNVCAHEKHSPPLTSCFIVLRQPILVIRMSLHGSTNERFL